MSDSMYCRVECKRVSRSEITIDVEWGPIHVPMDGSAPHTTMGTYLPSEMAQSGQEAAEAAWVEYVEATTAEVWKHDPFVAGYLAALPEDQG